MKQCDHCGRCCLSGVPCTFGAILFSITEKNPMRCPACEHKDKLYWCGLINNPLRWFPLLVGNIDWKCHAMSDIARIYIGIGDGCGMNPSKRELVSEIKARFKKNKAEMKRCKDCRKYKPCSVRASKQSLTLEPPLPVSIVTPRNGISSLCSGGRNEIYRYSFFIKKHCYKWIKNTKSMVYF